MNHFRVSFNSVVETWQSYLQPCFDDSRQSRPTSVLPIGPSRRFYPSTSPKSFRSFSAESKSLGPPRWRRKLRACSLGPNLRRSNNFSLPAVYLSSVRLSKLYCSAERESARSRLGRCRRVSFRPENWIFFASINSVNATRGTDHVGEMSPVPARIDCIDERAKATVVLSWEEA